MSDSEVWNRSLLAHHPFVAVLDGIIVRFGDMDQTGCLDRLYVHHVYQGRKIATALCDRLKESVCAARFVAHASVTAKPFLKTRVSCHKSPTDRMSWYVIEKVRDGKRKPFERAAF